MKGENAKDPPAFGSPSRSDPVLLKSVQPFHSELEKQGEIYAMLNLYLWFFALLVGELLKATLEVLKELSTGYLANPVRQSNLFAAELSPGGRY